MTKQQMADWDAVRESGRKAAIKAWAGMAISHGEYVDGVPCDMVARDMDGAVVGILTNRFELRSV